MAFKKLAKHRYMNMPNKFKPNPLRAVRLIPALAAMPSTRFLFFLLVLCLACLAQAAPSNQEIAKYSEQRWALFNSSSFNPYLVQAIEKALTDECMKLWREGKGVEAFAKCNEALKAFPFSILANRMLADMYQIYASNQSATREQQLKLRKLETEYRSAAEEIIYSILASGDGLSVETAYRVITISEEYMVLWFLGLTFSEQSVVKKGTKSFDALRVHDKQGKEKVVYFDVSAFAKKSGG